LEPIEIENTKYIAICVNASFYSLFSLRAYPLRDKQMNFINFGYPENGVIHPKELEVFRLVVESNKETTNITFKVSNP
jgi:hypothetical protein